MRLGCAFRMKHENTYCWSVIDRGKRRPTLAHLTEAEVRRDYPEGEPQPIQGTLVVREVPETAEEVLALWQRTPPG